jgi:hypothetical protein
MSVKAARNLFQHVRGDHHSPAFVGQSMKQFDQTHALHGIGPVEGLIQEQDLGIVNQRPGHLDALAHAFAVPADRSSGRVVHSNRGNRVGSRRRRVLDSSQPGSVLDKTATGQKAIDGVVFGHQSNTLEYRHVTPRVGFEHRQASAGRLTQAGHHAQQRGLAGSVWAQQTCDARPERARDARDGNLLAEPFGDLVDLNGRVRYEGRGMGGHINLW